MFPSLNRNSIAFRTTAIVLLASYLPACSGYHAEETTPQEVVTSKHPDRVRITRQDGSQIVVLKPIIQGDSLVGRAAEGPDSLRQPGAFGMPATGEPAGADSLEMRVAVALADIRTVETEQVNAGAVVIGVVLVGAVAAAIIAIAAASAKPTFNGQSSCPVVYAWNGNDWELQSGTFAGAVAKGVARTDVTAMPAAVTSDGELHLQVRNELAETDFLDAISVIAVDHPPGVTIAPDAAGGLHGVGTLVPASEARDFAGRDVGSALAVADGHSWESQVRPRDMTGAGASSDGIDLVFPRPREAKNGFLVVEARNTSWVPFILEQAIAIHGRAAQAWYDTLLANKTAAGEYRDAVVREAGLHVTIFKSGNWVPQGVVLDPGPEITKRQVVALDLTGVEDSVVTVRLESAPSFWLVDQVAVSYDAEPPFTVHQLSPKTAQTPDGKDVMSLVKIADGKAWSFEPREQADLRFRVPPPSAGMERSYLVRTTGWYTIHVPVGGDGDYAQLQLLIREPGAVAKFSASMLNDALRIASAPR